MAYFQLHGIFFTTSSGSGIIQTRNLFSDLLLLLSQHIFSSITIGLLLISGIDQHMFRLLRVNLFVYINPFIKF